MASACTASEAVAACGSLCYICFSGTEPDNPLELPCKCPRPVHLKCLARWNLQQAGGKEELQCRFCMEKLPDWKRSLSQIDVKSEAPILALKFEGKVYKMRVRPGQEGLVDFQKKVRSILGFSINESFEVSFEANLNGEMIRLSGIHSYDAATHCAAITAAERRKEAASSSASSGDEQCDKTSAGMLSSPPSPPSHQATSATALSTSAPTAAAAAATFSAASVCSSPPTPLPAHHAAGNLARSRSASGGPSGVGSHLAPGPRSISLPPNTDPRVGSADMQGQAQGVLGQQQQQQQQQPRCTPLIMSTGRPFWRRLVDDVRSVCKHVFRG